MPWIAVSRLVKKSETVPLTVADRRPAVQGSREVILVTSKYLVIDILGEV